MHDLSFLLTSLIVVASPGTGVLYTLAVALTQGARARIAAAFGCTLGIVPQMLAAMLGLAAVLHTSALAFAALKWCGVVYLLYMAWQALRETGALAIDARPGAGALQPARHRHGDPDQHPQSKTVDLLPRLPAAVHRRRRGPSAGADAGIERRLHGDDVCGVRASTACSRPRVRDRVITRPKVMTWLRRSFAAGFAALGAKLAFAER